MNDIPKAYEPAAVEEKWYRFWTESGFFQGDPDAAGEPFSVVMPPPNVTGSLHMGHALNITLQDVLVRWKRMQGFSVLWVPGTDHAGIATQNVVERQLAAEGLHRSDLGREAFEERVWAWKEQSEKNILAQIRRLGCSCDWSRTRFTLDEGLSTAVREVFVRLYNDGLIYRGEYLVNWCPRCATAISDLEVEHAPTNGKLWHLRYPLAVGEQHLTVATTRPETMLGDTAVAVHPEDERYRALVGQTVRLPLMHREIPIIADSFVDQEFGTGVVKVTPGHDPNDFEAGRRNGLEIISVIGESGQMTSEAGKYAGLDRFEARRRVVADLTELDLIEKIEDHAHSVGCCQRCETIVEPLVSTQWFVRVKPLAEPAIAAVEDGRTEFIPASYRKIYFEWMRNIHDWCISRQLWWGHRIPAWHCEACGETTVAVETPQNCSQCGESALRQESDVLDTWFSSGLWPFSTMGWPQPTPELKTFYPTSTLVTGFDIIFFWVARMMMLGLRFADDVPFREVHINGLVRDEKGDKMSKSRGNVIDPLQLIDEYGADAIRFTLSVMAVPGTDIPFSVSRMAGYRAFCNKIWNAGRFLLLNLEERDPVGPEQVEALWNSNALALEDRWILGRLQQIIERTNRNLEKFRFHEAANELYHFFWNDFCSWYIELVKARITSDEPDTVGVASRIVLYLLDTSLRLLHPFIPFVTEELWQLLPHDGETLMRAPYPRSRDSWIDQQAIQQSEQLQELISAIRTARTENRVPPSRLLTGHLKASVRSADFLRQQQHHLLTLARLDEVSFVDDFPSEGIQVKGVAQLAEFSLSLEDLIDLDAERERLGRQIETIREELAKLQRQLENSQFVERAPAKVVEGVRHRHAETSARLTKLKKQHDELSST